jgi:hypothetical protein
MESVGMNSIRLNSVVVLLAGCVLTAIAGGCLKYPLGSPQASTAETQFAGYWQWEKDKEGMVIAIFPHDEHTYVVEQTSYKRTDRGPRAPERQLYKGWLTTVGGKRFITLEPLTQRLPGAKEEDKYFATLRVTPGEGEVEVFPLNTEFAPLEKVSSSKDLAELVAREVENPKLYADGQKYKRLEAEPAQKLIEQIAVAGK